MAKTKIPHPKDAKSDADHMKFAQHSMQQIAEGHYVPKNVSVSRTDNDDGSMSFSANWKLEHADKNAPAADHNL